MAKYLLFMLGGHFEDPHLNLLGIFSLFQPIDLDEEFLDLHLIVPFVMIDFVPLFEALSLFLQLLYQNFVLFFIVLDVSVDALHLGLESFHVELDLVQLLILIVCDIIQNLALELLQCLFDVLGCDLLY